MAITDWPEGERPRERLLAQGAAALSDAELLAIFLRSGVKGKSAVELARDLLGHFGGLNQLFATTEKECRGFLGLGRAKYAQLQAVIEMARRALKEELRQGDALLSPAAVRDYPREVVKRALGHNAAGVILAHTPLRPVAEPSQADRWLTDQLKAALALVDVRVLDHFVVAGTQTVSFAELGLL